MDRYSRYSSQLYRKQLVSLKPYTATRGLVPLVRQTAMLPEENPTTPTSVARNTTVVTPEKTNRFVLLSQKPV